MTKPSKLLQWLHMSPLSMRGAPSDLRHKCEARWGQVRPGEAIMEGLGERWWKVCPLRCTEVQTKSFQIDVDWQVFPATIKLGTRWCHPVVIRLVHTHLTTDTTCYNHHKPEFYNLYSDKPVRFLTCYFSDLSSSIRIHSYPFHYGNLEQPQLFFQSWISWFDFLQNRWFGIEELDEHLAELVHNSAADWACERLMLNVLPCFTH